MANDTDGLSLELVNTNIEAEKSAPSGETMTCPKCELQQEKAEQCTSCGVFMSKVANSAPSTSNIVITKSVPKK